MVVWVHKKGKMASNNSKYTLEYRKEICQLIVSTGRSATSVSEEMGIDKNTEYTVRYFSKGDGLIFYLFFPKIKERTLVSEPAAEPLRERSYAAFGFANYKPAPVGVTCALFSQWA